VVTVSQPGGAAAPPYQPMSQDRRDALTIFGVPKENPSLNWESTDKMQAHCEYRTA